MLTKEKTYIPLNDNSFYIIKKGNWGYSIDIIMSNYLNFNILNLFMIIKSYVHDQFFFIEDVYVIISNEENFCLTFKKIEFDLIVKGDYDDFLSFFDRIIYSEKEYFKNYKYLGFRIIFNKSCSIFKTNEIYPIYPWNKEIIEHYILNSKWKFENTKFFFNDEESENLKNKIKNLEIENKKLLNEIQILKDKIVKK